MNNAIKDQSALIVVDMQKDFLLPPPTGKLYVPGTDEEISAFGGGVNKIIEEINKLAKKEFNSKSRIYFTTEDKHPPGHIEFEVFPPHCVEATEGQEYHEEMKELYKNAAGNIIKGDNKDITSYSIYTSEDFFEHVCFLRMKGIKNVYVVGVAYNFCVSETAIAYACQMFDTHIIRNMTLSVPDVNSDIESVLNHYGVTNIII